MKKINLILPIVITLALILFSASCSKKKDSPASNNNNNNTNTNTNPYYFRLTMNGSTDTVYDEQHYGYTTNANQIYGDVTQSTNGPVPTVSLQLGMPSGFDTLTESDVLGLAGKTIYFNDTTMSPDIEYQQTLSDTTWESVYGPQDTSNYVKITSVTFLDTTRYQGIPARRYVISGTCKTRMYLDDPLVTTYIDTPMSGSFNMIITRMAYK